jgi:transposase
MVVFEYSRQHNRDGPTSFLKEFRGYVQADAHPVYDPVYKDGRVEVGCWSHARRGFEKIVANSRRRSGLHAEVALAHIQGLFKVEKEAGEAGLDPAERHELRQTRSQPILEKLKPWIDDMLKVTPPRTALGESLAYLNNHWQALTRFLEDGRLEIHNNLVEQELRSIAVGRKNWTFFGNESGAEWGSVHYSLIASCRRAEVDPFLYLRDVLERISVHPASRVEELLPHRWKENFEAEARAAVQASLNELRG